MTKLSDFYSMLKMNYSKTVVSKVRASAPLGAFSYLKRVLTTKWAIGGAESIGGRCHF